MIPIFIDGVVTHITNNSNLTYYELRDGMTDTITKAVEMNLISIPELCAVVPLSDKMVGLIHKCVFLINFGAISARKDKLLSLKESMNIMSQMKQYEGKLLSESVAPQSTNFRWHYKTDFNGLCGYISDYFTSIGEIETEEQLENLLKLPTNTFYKLTKTIKGNITIETFMKIMEHSLTLKGGYAIPKETASYLLTNLKVEDKKEALLYIKEMSTKQKGKYGSGFGSPHDRSFIFKEACLYYLETGDKEMLEIVSKNETSINFYLADNFSLAQYLKDKNSYKKTQRKDQNGNTVDIFTILDSYKQPLMYIASFIGNKGARTEGNWYTTTQFSRTCFWLNQNTNFVTTFEEN